MLQASTEEVEQRFNVDSADWAIAQINAHSAECPDGWQALICWGDHPAMMLAPYEFIGKGTLDYMKGLEDG